MALSNKDKLKEIEYLYNRSICIIDFILGKSENDLVIFEYKEIIEGTRNKNDLRGMRTISRDMNAWAKGLKEKEIKELEKLLISRFNDNLSGDKITHRIIRKVIKRESINSDNEYRVVHEYLIDLSKKDLFFKNLNELNHLLDTYIK